MASSSYCYVQEAVLESRTADVWQVLCTPEVYAAWCSSVTVRHYDGQPLCSLTTGSRWRESYHGALFLRSWLDVTVLSHDPSSQCLRISLDDGHNHIQQQLQVLPGGSQGTCRILSSLECYQHTPNGTHPSEKLAVMFRKHDKRLASLAAYLSRDSAAAGAAAAVPAPAAAVCAPLIPV